MLRPYAAIEQNFLESSQRHSVVLCMDEHMLANQYLIRAMPLNSFADVLWTPIIMSGFGECWIISDPCLLLFVFVAQRPKVNLQSSDK